MGLRTGKRALSLLRLSQQTRLGSISGTSLPACRKGVNPLVTPAALGPRLIAGASDSYLPKAMMGRRRLNGE